MFIACYIVVMLIAFAGVVVFGLSTGWSAWRTVITAGGVLAVGQVVLLGYIVTRMFFTRPASEALPDSHPPDPARPARSGHRP